MAPSRSVRPHKSIESADSYPSISTEPLSIASSRPIRKAVQAARDSRRTSVLYDVGGALDSQSTDSQYILIEIHISTIESTAEENVHDVRSGRDMIWSDMEQTLVTLQEEVADDISSDAGSLPPSQILDSFSSHLDGSVADSAFKLAPGQSSIDTSCDHKPAQRSLSPHDHVGSHNVAVISELPAPCAALPGWPNKASMESLQPTETAFMEGLSKLAHSYVTHITHLHEREQEMLSEWVSLRARCRLLEDHNWMLRSIIIEHGLEVPLEPPSQYV
ncbi:hypothetical protein C8Q78DRAFT_991883 [Trametes maxima]|nr:hypothetical protein C8Q78DRAFT_991883 [Trametes maxima]